MEAHELSAMAEQQLEEALASHVAINRIRLATFAATALTIFVAGAAAYVLAVAVLTAQLGTWALGSRARRQQATGDQCRMRALLLDALGPTGARVDYGNLLRRISPEVRQQSAAVADPNYYASTAAPGLLRLREHLQENAFWNKSLYDSAADARLRAVVALGIAAGGVVLVAIPLAPRDQALLAARVLVVALSFFATLDQIREIGTWRSASDAIGQVDQRLETLTACSPGELMGPQAHSFLAAYGDYCAISSATPPIPKYLYLKHRDHLNVIWRERTNMARP